MSDISTPEPEPQDWPEPQPDPEVEPAHGDETPGEDGPAAS